MDDRKVQYSLSEHDLVDISYVLATTAFTFSRNSWSGNELPVSALALGNQLNQQVPNPFFGSITSSGCGLSNPTVPKRTVLLPFPEYCSVTEAQLRRRVDLNALQATYTHRWHSGWSSTFPTPIRNSWTTSRELPDGIPRYREFVRNSYNLAAERFLDASDLTHSLGHQPQLRIAFGKGKQFGW